jgi:hypothetical protein
VNGLRTIRRSTCYNVYIYKLNTNKELNTNKITHIQAHKQAIQFLRKAKTKVALQTQFDGPFIYAEKTDFIEMLQKLEYDNFADYDGFNRDIEIINNVLHIPAGII